ncbi:hypothetical protein HUJ04_012104 [Dendroctonus ponderosae]|nr:hypothetical protein HUJ04_012104 [Dendroctonus ponderosae]KAH1029241.1 hypothetical protein HUJ05_002513 [Dendroctonus ponderosae]
MSDATPNTPPLFSHHDTALSWIVCLKSRPTIMPTGHRHRQQGSMGDAVLKGRYLNQCKVPELPSSPAFGTVAANCNESKIICLKPTTNQSNRRYKHSGRLLCKLTFLTKVFQSFQFWTLHRENFEFHSNTPGFFFEPYYCFTSHASIVHCESAILKTTKWMAKLNDALARLGNETGVYRPKSPAAFSLPTMNPATFVASGDTNSWFMAGSAQERLFRQMPVTILLKPF